jgi:hypothetical protein
MTHNLHDKNHKKAQHHIETDGLNHVPKKRATYGTTARLVLDRYDCL